MTDQEAAKLLAHYAELLATEIGENGQRSTYGLLCDASSIVIKGKASNTQEARMTKCPPGFAWVDVPPESRIRRYLPDTQANIMGALDR